MLAKTSFHLRPLLLRWLIALLLSIGCRAASAQNFPFQAIGLPEVIEGNFETQFAPRLDHPISPEATRAQSGETQAEPETASLARRIEEIEAQLKNRDDADRRKEANKDKPANQLDKFKEKWNVKMGGHVQMDYINWANASPAIQGAQDYFEFRRLRLLAEGNGYGVYDFRLQMTLESESLIEAQTSAGIFPEVKDAYLSMNEIPGVGRFRIGNFFVPFGLEQVTNDTNNIFLERSIPTQGIFTPDREVGMALYNCTEAKDITWSTGIFLDSVSEGLRERIDDNQGYRVSGRLTWLPYYDTPSEGRYLFFTGLGVLYSDDQDNRVRFRARPQVRESPRLIDSGFLNATSYTTGNLESAIVLGSFSIQSEAYLSQVNFLDTDRRQLQGAYVHCSYFLTGESRIFERFGQHGPQFGRNVPNNNFFIAPCGCGPGAWEFKSRWSYLDLHSVGTGQYNDLTVGLNWYWSDRTRVMFDWIHPMTSGETVFGATESDLLGMRFDFNW